MDLEMYNFFLFYILQDVQISQLLMVILKNIFSNNIFSKNVKQYYNYEIKFLIKLPLLYIYHYILLLNEKFITCSII